MAKAISNPHLEPTSPIDVQFGVFESGNYRLPYMSCILTAKKCADYLALASDDPELTLASGKLEELFQRDIDEPRVHEIATRYLSPNVAQRPPFFNSITVALLPRGTGKDIAPNQTSEDKDANPISAVYGPARVSWSTDNPEHPGRPPAGHFGTISWNKNGLKAVAIDGQHRLAALKKLTVDHPKPAEKLLVSTLILLFDEGFGLRAGDVRPIAIMRQLFIDLNKHAQRVTRARQLLLDDLEPLSIALRACIGNELDFKKTNTKKNGLHIGEAGEFNIKLPLEFVDWHGEQRAKVDTGPYAISVLGLEWALLRLCKSNRFNRLVDLGELAERDDRKNGEKSGQDYYGAIRKSLESWLQHIPTISDEINEAKDSEIPYTPSKGVVKEMGESVASIWGPALTRLMTSAAPYRRLAEYRIQNTLFSAQFGCWCQARQTARAVPETGAWRLDPRKLRFDKVQEVLEEQEKGIAKKFERHINHIDNNIKKVNVEGTDPAEHLLFSLTGQRALILTLAKMFDACNDEDANERKLADELKVPQPTTETEAAELLAEVLGQAVSHWDKQCKGFLFTKAATCKKYKTMPTNLWCGSLLKRDSAKTIDFSGIAAERTARTIHLMAATWMYRKTAPSATTVDAIKKWLKSGKVDSAKDLERSASGRQLKKAVLHFTGINDIGTTKGDKYPILFLAKMPVGDASALEDQEIRDFAASRVEWIWDHSRAG